MAQHTCSHCAEEAVPERCPFWRPDDAWTDEDALTATNLDTPEARMSVCEALARLREAPWKTT